MRLNGEGEVRLLFVVLDELGDLREIPRLVMILALDLARGGCGERSMQPDIRRDDDGGKRGAPAAGKQTVEVHQRVEQDRRQHGKKVRVVRDAEDLAAGPA